MTNKNLLYRKTRPQSKRDEKWSYTGTKFLNFTEIKLVFNVKYIDCICVFLFFFSFGRTIGMQNLSSLIRDQICAHCIGSSGLNWHLIGSNVLTTGPPGSPRLFAHEVDCNMYVIICNV